MENRPLVFLKLGGSLITEKDNPHTARMPVLRRLTGEIAAACRENPHLRLLLGHGSGSFGHVPAKRYGTRQGVSSPGEWLGFVEVWREAGSLNQLVMETLAENDLPAVAFSPMASVTAADGKIVRWNLEPIKAALNSGLLPVVYGDVIFDDRRGGTILSTEDLFGYLAQALQPARILLAGLETGVWADFPARTHLIHEITPENLAQIRPGIRGSLATDVTGGMLSKISQAMAWAQAVDGLEVVIFSGETPGTLRFVLGGGHEGTRIYAGLFHKDTP